MTIEKLSFQLPASFTIGPDLSGGSTLSFEDIDNLKLYARYLANSAK